jgi:hypothetical protein
MVMPPRKQKIKPLQIILLVAGCIALVYVMRISTFWDDTQYYESKSVANTMSDAEAQRTVFICTTRDSRLYHFYTDCSVLGKCADNIKDLTARDAETMGRVECSGCKD